MQMRARIMNLFSAEGILRLCEVVAIVAGLLAVAALVGQTIAGRVVTNREKLKTAEQQERAANAERSLLELQKLVREPRYLNWDDAKKILETGPKGEVEILYTDGNQGAFLLAHDLYGLLGAYGWKVSQPQVGTAMLPVTGTVLEVSEGWKAGENPLTPELPEPGKTLYSVLTVSLDGLGQVGLRANQKLPKGALRICVGPKY
jgi:hypothetical protein